ncbi:ABC transporter ATP-binding protein [Rhizobium viscosum]|uniref:ABC-type polysaccharide/polyol phosphate transport system ATPase subunit n=1 Tax=Rhizobium viscosum TaxID=1673 RepID=A0ABR9IZC8_RHIVS|nr:ABC transporter ATP-binding protein [Rhizobium viscosum]MBE1508573.1 ABC-type polysaccharide/polyol phosphate transport system ATPase subunit [Rhizobium viscosum]
MAHIRVKNVSISYPIFNAHSRSLRTAVFSKLGGTIVAHNNTVVVDAIKDLTLNLENGDRLALLGHNGAGKTTLLRALAGVYPPLKGSIDIEGRISSFTDITLGMDTEASGWDNIIFRCAFMGLSFKEAHALAPSIAEFSELGDFLDMPVRTYSSGMFVRLAFAISTSIEPDIVIMDEMISAGDAQFISKARARIEKILGNASVFVIASHDISITRQFCKTALWLEKGVAKALGPVDEITEAYLASRATDG